MKSYIERDVDCKIFMLKNFVNKDNMQESIKMYIKKLKDEYPIASITREFYKYNSVLVRATEINNKKDIKQKEILQKEKDDWYIKQRGK